VKGTIDTVESSHDPVVLKGPFEIEFLALPHVGFPFVFFSEDEYGNPARGHTGTVQGVRHEEGVVLFRTRRSTYELRLATQEEVRHGLDSQGA
jgi:hypothetical protein